MFERMTDRGRRAISIANGEAADLNHSYIGTEHMLLGLLREGGGVAFKALDALGVTYDGARSTVEELIGLGANTSRHMAFTPRAKKVIELALREALTLGHNYVGTEHLLLGIVREGEGVAMQVLAKAGVDHSAVRSKVLELLASYTTAEVATAEMEQDRQAPRVFKAPGSPSDLRVPFPFPLRPDFLASLELPANLNRAEANRLVTFIMSIPDDE